MSAFPIQCSLPFCRSESSKEKVDCLYYSKIAAFAIGVILLVAGILALSGAFGSLGGEISWTLAALGIAGLVISCVRCSNNPSTTKSHRDVPMSSTSQATRHDPIPTWPNLQNDSLSQRDYFNSASSVRSSGSLFKQENPQTDNPHFKQAEEYLMNGDLAAALKEIKKIYTETEIKEQFIIKLAKAYLSQNNKEQAFRTIKEIIHNHEIKEEFLDELAHAYVAEGNNEQAFKTIKEIIHNHGTKESFLAKLAQAYLTKGNKEQAFKTIKEIIHNHETKESFLVKLAQAYLTEGNKEQAFKTIKEIVHNHETKESFLAKLAQAYLTEGNKEQAFKTIKEIIHNHETKESFLVKLAQAYLTEGNKEQAFKTIKEIVHNHETKESFLAKLAQAYLAEGNKDQAFTTIEGIVHDRETKDACFAQLAQAYFNDKNEIGVLQILEEIVKKSLINKLLESGYRDKYFETLKLTTCNNKIFQNFYAQVAQECYSEVKVHFDQRNSLIAINLSKKIAVSPKYLEVLKQRVSQEEAKPTSNFQAQEKYTQANTSRKPPSQLDIPSFTYRGGQPSDKQSVINLVMSDPNSFHNLSYDLRNNEDVVAAALDGCTSPEQAKKVISNANYDAKNSKKVALILVRIDPTQFGQLNYDAKNDEDVVAAALNGCTSPEQAKKVISNANYDAKNSKKVALALVRIDPTQFGQLNYDAKNDEDVVAAALNGCKSPEEAKKVISNAHYDAKNSKKVALILVRIDPTLLGQLYYDAKNDLDVVLLAIKLSTEHTINKIWSSIGANAALNKEVRAKVKEKYPNFFQDRTFDDTFSNFFQSHGTFQGFPSSKTQNTSNQTPHHAAQTKWDEPDDLKGNTSAGANIARKILERNHCLAIDLTKTNVSKGMAKTILCRLLELDVNTSDIELKKAYKKDVLLIHPDKLKLQSGEEAFKALTAAYAQAEL